VPVRRYAWGAHGYSIIGVEDRQLLLDAGIEAYLKFDRSFGPALVVPESELAAARRVLAARPDLFERHFAPPCPRCHTFHPGVRPPYEIVLVGATFVAAAAVVIIGGSTGVAIAILAVGVISGAILSSHLPHWRCHACGYAFDSTRRE
jgi:hypothetical protein